MSLPKESNFERVYYWMKQVGQETPKTLQRNPGEQVKELRKRLILEEVNELFHGMNDNDIVEIADGLADLLVVVYGTAVAYGIPMNAVFTEVMDSNDSKIVDGLKDSGGKVLKGPSYFPPNIARVLGIERSEE